MTATTAGIICGTGTGTMTETGMIAATIGITNTESTSTITIATTDGERIGSSGDRVIRKMLPPAPEPEDFGSMSLGCGKSLGVANPGAEVLLEPEVFVGAEYRLGRFTDHRITRFLADHSITGSPDSS